VDAGLSFDHLFVGDGRELSLDHLSGIEQVDLGQHSVLTVSADDVLRISDATPNTLVVTGDASDTVVKDGGYTHAAGDTQVVGGTTFDVWHAASGGDVATLLLEQGVHAQVTP
jgi:hypothetical protein